MSSFLYFKYTDYGKVGKTTTEYSISRSSIDIKVHIEKEMHQFEEVSNTIWLSNTDLYYIFIKIYHFLEHDKGDRVKKDYINSIGTIDLENTVYTYYDNDGFFSMVFSIISELCSNEANKQNNREFLKRYNAATQKIYKRRIVVNTKY